MSNKIWREGYIDGFLTRHELPETERLWNDCEVWKPVEEGHKMQLYIVRGANIDSDQYSRYYYYVCRFIPSKGFYEVNSWSTKIDPKKFNNCYWSVL